MSNRSSPWIHQLDATRPYESITKDISTDVVIVGAGIAGISTAFFSLKYTSKKVVLVEASKVAHGATGHNAGQIVSYFEHPFARLVDLYGVQKAAKAQENIFYAWDLLEEMYRESGATTPLSRFTGYAGCSSIEQIVEHLANIKAQREAGLDIEGVLVANLSFVIDKIPAAYRELFARIDHKEVGRLLETSDRRYIGVLASRKGCVNSAVFCEQVIKFLQRTYSERFTVYEQSPVERIILAKNEGVVTVGTHRVTAEKIVLCTNGFSNFTIKNTVGDNLNERFHKMVIGKIGYMAAYLENSVKPPVAISYFTPAQSSQKKAYDRAKSLDEQDPYFYLTRRKFEHRTHGLKNLICVGGPESDVPDTPYENITTPFPENTEQEITDFLSKTFASFPQGKQEYAFTWSGLMGYTPTGLRCIGPDPTNPVLLYNIGCNGVGILSSIYGGKRISAFLTHSRLEPSIFDPEHSLF